MNREKKLKFKFKPTPTLAKLYEQQGLYQDALRIFEFLHSSGTYNFHDKIQEIKNKIDPDNCPRSKEPSLTKLVLSQDNISLDEVEAGSEWDSSRDNDVALDNKLLVAEYNSMINLLFNDEEKCKFRIVPSDEFYYTSKGKLSSIFSQEVNGEKYIPFKNDNENKKNEYQEILDSNEDIGPEVTVEDFVNILYTYYSKSTKITDIKIGDLFFLLSSIKIENS